MPRADRLSLTVGGLAVPSVGHLSNNAVLNLALERIVGSLPASVAVGIYVNLSRLSDKALREFDAARAELMSYVARSQRLLIGHYSRAIDHMENAVDAAYRAVLNSEALRGKGVGLRSPVLTSGQRERLKWVRDAIEHSDEKLLGRWFRKDNPPFDRSDPFSLRLANTSMTIGKKYLTYKDLVSVMSKCHKTLEVIRGVAIGTPGPTFPNAELRTNPGQRVGAHPMIPSAIVREGVRLGATQS